MRKIKQYSLKTVNSFCWEALCDLAIYKREATMHWITEITLVLLQKNLCHFVSAFKSQEQVVVLKTSTNFLFFYSHSHFSASSPMKLKLSATVSDYFTLYRMNGVDQFSETDIKSEKKMQFKCFYLKTIPIQPENKTPMCT